VLASIGHRWVLNGLVPIDLTTTASTSDLVGAGVDTLTDSVPELSIEERICS